MARKKLPKRKPPNYQHPRVVFHLPQELLDVVDAAAAGIGRTRTAEIIWRLQEAYVAAGLWPPSAGSSAKGS
jgi:hypothetical protein